MPAPHCYGSARFSRVRLSLLDPDTLAPDLGAENGYVINSQILMNMGVVVEEGEEFTQKNGEGEVCQSLQEDSTFKRVTIRLRVCNLDPVLDSLLTGARLFEDSGVAVGAQTPAGGTAIEQPICFEGWTRATDGTGFAFPAATSPDAAYWHWVFPYAHGFTFADTELASGIHVFEYNGLGDDNTAITVNGPFNDWPDYIVAAGGVTGARGYFLDGPPPDSNCELEALTAS
jgi:hypothetical protein